MALENFKLLGSKTAATAYFYEFGRKNVLNSNCKTITNEICSKLNDLVDAETIFPWEFFRSYK